MQKGKVSVIIPCFNYGEYLSEAIDSVLNQTYDNIEIVVINDGSTDNSSKIIRNYADKYKNIIFFDEKENKGVVNSRNIGINAASGEYILPLDADDTIAPEYIEKAVKILDKEYDIGIVYCEADFLNSKNEKWDLPPYNEEKFRYTNMIFVSAIFRKCDFLKVGGFKDYMNMGYEDWDFWMHLIERGIKPYKIPEVLFHYRKHDKSRNKKCLNNEIKCLRTLFKNHLNFYINDDEFIKKIFRDNSKDLCDEYLKLYKYYEELYLKYKKLYSKYKKLFKVIISLFIVESFFIILYFLGVLK